jgi:hydrogenase-4 membrane subunit HyfE
MNHTTRDNLIYLAVGLGIVGILVADVIYFDGRGQQAWFPSAFAFRTGIVTLLIAYFVTKDTLRQQKAALAGALACALLAVLIQLCIAFIFRQFVSDLSGVGFIFWGTMDVFVIHQLALQAARYSRLGRWKRHT